MCDPQLKKVPGPGVYQAKEVMGDAPKFSMGTRNSQSSITMKNSNPGPGTYQPVNVTHVSNKYSIKGKHNFGTQLVVSPDGGHEKVPSNVDGNVPGPGAYSAKTSYVFRNNGNSKFGTEARPGLNSNQHANTPAPNAYSRDAKSAVMKSAPRFGFGSSTRPTSHGGRTQVPGPGTYQQKTLVGTETQGKTLGQKLEAKKTSNMFTPGAGTYQPNFSQA